MEDGPKSVTFDLYDGQKEFLGQQARRAIQTVLDGNTGAKPAEPGPDPLQTLKDGQDAPVTGDSDWKGNPPADPLRRKLGSFVTLKQNGNLRGCIGTIVGHEPLYLNVWNMARAAAFDDPRFPPLTATEWPHTTMEISVLFEPRYCWDVSTIVIGRDGLILTLNGRNGVFLPQVPVEQNWNLQEYLDNLSIKAGLPKGSWKHPQAHLYTYQALVFPA